MSLNQKLVENFQKKPGESNLNNDQTNQQAEQNNSLLNVLQINAPTKRAETVIVVSDKQKTAHV